MSPTRRRSTIVTVGATALVLASLTGCSSGPDYAGVCVDRATTKRVPDRDCDDSHGGSGGRGWYYIGSGQSAPAVGASASGGSFAAPSDGTVTRGGVSAKGGTVSRGGFFSGHGSVGG